MRAYFAASQHIFTVPLNNQGILDMLLRESGPFWRVKVPESWEGALHIAGDYRSVSQVSSGVGIIPLKVLLRPLQETLSLVVEVAGAKLVEEGLSLGVVLPHSARTKLTIEGSRARHFGHIEELFSPVSGLMTFYCLLLFKKDQCCPRVFYHMFYTKIFNFKEEIQKVQKVQINPKKCK